VIYKCFFPTLFIKLSVKKAQNNQNYFVGFGGELDRNKNKED
tara:strand:- start:2111 stop:2236 length:126 start_codon:yes stop_codon:yes gene_type:complete